jgi:hypothetical protein
LKSDDAQGCPVYPIAGTLLLAANLSAFPVTSADDLLGSNDAELGLASDKPLGEATDELGRLFDQHNQEVFFSRQLEVRYEERWFHWITNRAIRNLVAQRTVRSERRALATGGEINLLWHRSYRYYRRGATRLIGLVNEYADPNIGAALGLQGEALVLEGIARQQFLMRGRNVKHFGSRVWLRSDHDLDFIFEADGIAYGVEVKNTLGYMDHDELAVKIELCESLGLRPVFAVRMLPKTWIYEVINAGGFALIFKYQLYPWTHRDLARRVRQELELPVDAPRTLQQGTMERFVRWHRQSVS